MKKNNTLVIIFFILLIVIGFLFFLTKKQNFNNLRLKNIFQNNQVGQKNFNQSEIPTIEPVSQGITLEINEPKANAVFSRLAIKVSGKTSPEAEVYLNDRQTKADAAGNFSFDYNLDEGENLLTVVANDASGNYAEKEITVYLQTNE